MKSNLTRRLGSWGRGQMADETMYPISIAHVCTWFALFWERNFLFANHYQQTGNKVKNWASSDKVWFVEPDDCILSPNLSEFEGFRDFKVERFCQEMFSPFFGVFFGKGIKTSHKPGIFGKQIWIFGTIGDMIFTWSNGWFDFAWNIEMPRNFEF